MPDSSNRRKDEIPSPRNDGLEQGGLTQLEKEAIESKAQHQQFVFLAQFSTFTAKALSYAWLTLMVFLFLGVLIAIASVTLYYFTSWKFMTESHANAALRFVVDGVIANALYRLGKIYGPRLVMLGDPFRDNETY